MHCVFCLCLAHRAFLLNKSPTSFFIHFKRRGPKFAKKKTVLNAFSYGKICNFFFFSREKWKNRWTSRSSVVHKYEILTGVGWSGSKKDLGFWGYAGVKVSKYWTRSWEGKNKVIPLLDDFTHIFYVSIILWTNGCTCRYLLPTCGCKTCENEPHK